MVLQVQREVKVSAPPADAAENGSTGLRTTTRAHKPLSRRKVVASNGHETQFIVN